MKPAVDGEKGKISSPEKVARILERLSGSGIPLVLRPVSSPTVAIKGRAVPSYESAITAGLRVGNISEKGMEVLATHAKTGVQVEFVLTSSKLMFQTTISHLSRQECVLVPPAFLTSIERRKDARHTIHDRHRAFVSFEQWSPLPDDLLSPPILDMSLSLSHLTSLGDVSIGGASVVSYFPGIYKFVNRGSLILPASLHLPMLTPMTIEASIRWCRQTTEGISEPGGLTRIERAYRFGIQFMNPSEEFLKNLKIYIQKIAQAEAI